ncbi:PAS domain-containing sensor histidine kinase [Geomonas propionica]|uniref:histidine kinase n=1 Tax=Geomonas propionica TaxID=2798582 RepID=A0ABS0YQX0_9BACT|nr:PAS domain-containing sensor histidine kinase [Geomonas propionica]MBJ6800371.1 PAS domain S-box protein [Geomonas propionica]
MPNIFEPQNAAPELTRACFDFSHVAGELEESRKRLSAVFDTVQVGIVIIDAETHTIVDANPKAVELIGTAKEAVVGSVCHCFICPEQSGHCPITDQGQRIDNAERQLLRPSGDAITVVKTVARVRLYGRDHLIESFLDITDRKRAEEELRASEERYRDILENANDLIQSVDAQGNFIYVNNAWKKTMGYTDQEVAKLNIFDVIKPCCQSHCATMFDQLKSGARIPRVEVEFVAKDGRSIILEGSINCNTSDGHVSTRGVFRDITERKQMEAELTQSEDRYRKLFENAPEAILVQHEGRYVCANKQACHLLGVDRPEELIGQSIFSFVHPDFHAMVVERIQQIHETGEPSPLRESKMVQKGGAVIDVEAVSTGIVFQGQQSIQVIIRDITERKQVEEQRRELNSHLERMVEEKTRHLKEAQAKLIQSEKMATLGEVIAGAAHELNNPLAGILGAIQMLRSSALAHPIDPELMDGIDVLESIESAAVRCQKIVEDLVRFTTQARCNFSDMDINEVLRDTLEIMSGPFEEQKVKVTLQQDAEVPRIEGDFVKLLEVYVNLLQNAKSALPNGGRIDISTALVKKYGEPLQVSVVIRDDGCGIPPQNLAKIFDPFFTTKPAGKGPGLGLTVCYGIVKRHGGDIDVRSTVGKGTEVTVTVPVRQQKGLGYQAS